MNVVNGGNIEIEDSVVTYILHLVVFVSHLYSLVALSLLRTSLWDQAKFRAE